MKTNSQKDFYEILGISKTDDLTEIRKAFRKQALLSHPDKGGNEDTMKLVNEAYRTLLNVQLRQQFDQQREEYTDVDEEQKMYNEKCDVMKLSMGEKFSDKHIKQVAQWQAEFKFVRFSANQDIETQVRNVMNEILQKNREVLIFQKKRFACDICNAEFEDQESHDATILKPLDQLINGQEQFITQQQISEAIFGREVEQVIPVNYADINQTSDFLLKISQEKTIKLEGNKNCEQIAIKIYQGDLSASDKIKKILKQLQNKKSNNSILEEEVKQYIQKCVSIRSQRIKIFKENQSLGEGNIDVYFNIYGIEKLFSKQHILKIQIEQKPEFIPDNDEPECLVCSERFTFFRRHHHCRNCGHNICANCSVSSILPFKNQFSQKERICKNCQENMKNFHSVAWMKHAETLINHDRNQESVYALYISSLLDKDDQFFKQYAAKLGDILVQKNYIEGGLACFRMANLDVFKILVLAENLSREGLYVDCQSCFMFVGKQNEAFWIAYSKKYVQSYKSNQSESILILCLLSITQLNSDSIKAKILPLLKDDISSCLLFYFITVTMDGKKIIPNLLKLFQDSESFDVSIYYCLLMEQINTESLLQLLSQLQNYLKITSFLKFIDQSRTPDWLSTKIEAKNVSLLVQYLFNKRSPDYFLKELQKCYKSKSGIQLIKSILKTMITDSQTIIQECIWVRSYSLIPFIICLDQVPNEQFLKHGVHLLDYDTPNAFVCFKSSGLAAQQIGEFLVSKKKMDAAIRYFQQQPLKERIQALYNIASALQDLRFYKSLYEVIKQEDGPIYFKMINELIDINKNSSKYLKIILIQNIKANPKLKDQNLLCIRRLIKPDQALGISQIVAIDHQISKLISNQEIERNIKILRAKKENDNFLHLKGYIALSNFSQIAEILLQESESIDQEKLLNLLSEYKRNDNPIENAMNEFLKGSCFWIQKEFQRANSHFLNSVYHYPDKELMIIVSNIIQSQSYQMGIIDSVFKDIRNFKVSKIDQFKNLTENLELPKESKYSQKLQMNVNLRTILKFENGIDKSSRGNFEAAMLYLDMIMCAQGITSVASCFILSSLYLLKEISLENDPSLCYAYRNLILELTQVTYFISQKSMIPNMRIYFSKIILSLVIETNVEFNKKVFLKYLTGGNQLIDDDQIRVLSGSLQSIIDLTKIGVNFSLVIHKCFDMLFIDCIQHQFTDVYFKQLESTFQSNTLCTKEALYYYFLEGTWKQWFSERSFEDARLQSMELLLREKGWNFETVQSIMNYPLVGRCKEGYLLKEKHRLILPGKITYSKLRGFEINLENGQLQLMLVESKGGNGLFDMNDISFVLQQGIACSYFTLDPPNREYSYHPFQNMVYSPESLRNSYFLSTLLQCDYMLKMFSMGKECSANYPFAYRSIDETFFQRLPRDLQEELKPINQRKDSKAWTGQAHRFWIESGDLQYWRDTSKDGKIVFRFGELQMKVNMMPMQLDKDGKLQDILDSIDKDSAESQFVNSFTKNYDRIGQYFPEFLRLKEIAKIQAISQIVQSLYTNMQKQIPSMRTDIDSQIRTSVQQHIQYLGSNNEYPKNTNANKSKFVEECLSQSGVRRSDIPYSQMNELENKIESQLQAADNQIYESMRSNICKSFDVQFGEVQSEFNNWIRNSSYHQRSLVDKIVSIRVAREVQKLKNFMNGIENQKIKVIKSVKQPSSESSTYCTWVPAVFEEKDTFKVYGGINLFNSLVQMTTHQHDPKDWVTMPLTHGQYASQQILEFRNRNDNCIIGTSKVNSHQGAQSPLYWQCPESNRFMGVTFHQDSRVHLHFRNMEQPTKTLSHYLRYDSTTGVLSLEREDPSKWK